MHRVPGAAMILCRGTIFPCTLCSMSTPERATVQVRRDQREALTRVAGELTASEGKRYSLADAIQRLLDYWRSGPGSTAGQTEAG